ncbi:hypothetical protein ILYODFUR_006248 [Ilyodon furcidens]|uniref:Uncharacterized protein n=1 Tax=Ilyodon furcidens TaxID=33524 RepID=A0ABV0SXR0_9TELE
MEQALGRTQRAFWWQVKHQEEVQKEGGRGQMAGKFVEETEGGSGCVASCFPMTHLQFNDSKQVTTAESERVFVNQQCSSESRGGKQLTTGEHMQKRRDET